MVKEWAAWVCAASPMVWALGCVKAISLRWQEDKEPEWKYFHWHCSWTEAKFWCLFGARITAWLELLLCTELYAQSERSGRGDLEKGYKSTGSKETKQKQVWISFSVGTQNISNFRCELCSLDCYRISIQDIHFINSEMKIRSLSAFHYPHGLLREDVYLFPRNERHTTCLIINPWSVM